MVKGIKGIFRAYFEDYLLIAIEKFDYSPPLRDFDNIPDQNASFKFFQSPLQQSSAHSLDTKRFLRQIAAVSPSRI